MTRLRNALILFSAMLLLFFGCTEQDKAKKRKISRLPLPLHKPAFGDMIILGSIADCCVLLPILCTDRPSTRITDLIFNGLLKYDQNINLIGDLAEKWEVSPDNLRIKFHLRKNVRWHDGKPFTAHDVQFTHKVYVDPKTPTAFASSFMKIKEIRILDDFTIEAVYCEPYAPALESWVTNKILPKHLLDEKDVTQSELRTSPIGTGPYKFCEWKTGEKIILEANEHYYDGRPYISRVVSRTIPDPATMFLELKANRLDSMTLTPVQFIRQTQTPWFEKNFKKYRYPNFGYTYLGYNLRDWKFSDKRVRQAITSAINREGIVKGALLGLGQVAHSPYKPDTFYYNPNIRKWPYNPELAKKLLEEAGWRDTDGDGILDKQGKPFESTIILNQGNEIRKNAATIIQSDLRAVGIRVKIRVIEWAAFLKDFLGKGNFEMYLCGWLPAIDPDGIDQWHSTKTGTNQFNHGGYSNEEVDRLLELGVRYFDPWERKKYYDRFQEIISEEQPFTFLWVDDVLQIVHSRFQNIKPAPMGIAYNFEKWYSPRPLQKHAIQD